MSEPVFRKSYAVEVLDDEHVLVLGERANSLLTGSAYSALAAGLTSGKSVAQIAAEAPEGVTAADIFYALSLLEKDDLVRPPDQASPPSVQGFWDSLKVDPANAATCLASARLTLCAIGDLSTEPLAHALAATGITESEEEGNFGVVVTDDYLRPELALWNQAFLDAKMPWMLVRPVGSILWIGPLLRPGTTACWECLADRMRGQRLVERHVQTHKGLTHPQLAANYALPSTELAAAALVATEIARSIAGAESQIEGALVTFDLHSMTTQRHVVVRRPQCRACGDADSFQRRTPEPIELQSRIKGLTSDGGHRATSPEETVARYGHHVSPLTGIVREMRPTTLVDPTVAPIYVCGANASMQDGTIGSLRRHFRARNGGKGKTDAQARASALCEAIERHCGVFQGNEHRVRATYRSLGDDAIHPNACMQFSDKQYAERAQENRFVRTPPRFDEEAEIEWTPLWSLTEKRFKYLPTSYCYYEYDVRDVEDDDDGRFCWPDSNGCAAGNSIEEAILQGFFELLDRDAVALWWYNRVRRPAVELQSFRETYFEALTDYYRSLRRDLWVLDITTDLGIPVFAAVSRRSDITPEDILLGFGCHLDPAIAVQRALTEVNQMLPAVIDRDRGENSEWELAHDPVRELIESTVSSRPYLAPAEGMPFDRSHYQNLQFDDLKDEIELCVRAAAALGLETLVLDQTRPDIGLPVVRVVVPGLRHFWARFAPGRLYDVPVNLGWLSKPLSEDELNPVPLTF
jgi:ribosomal protein S12 methylthiotransferase accessory factor